MGLTVRTDLNDGPAGWGRPLHECVLDAACVRAGTELLDLGCGNGAFARAAAARGARVTGVDADRAAVATASAAVPDGRFRLGDAHELDAAPASVDAVAAVQLVSHVTNPLRVLREAGRVVRPEGIVAVTVWGREAECEVRAFGEALGRWLPRRPDGGPPPLTEPDRLRRLVRVAGLEVAAVEEVACTFDYPDADALLDPLLEAGMGRLAVVRAGRAAVCGAVLDRLAEYRTPAGGYRLTNLFRVLTACPS